MHEVSALHNALWVRQLAEQLKTGGLPVKALLAEARIEPRSLNAEDSRLPFDQIATFFEQAAGAVGDSCLGFHFGQSRDPRDVGLLGYIGLSSPTVRDALCNIARYTRVFSDAVAIEPEALEDTGVITWHFRGAPTLRQQQFIEFSVTNILRTFRSLTGRNLSPARVTFSHSRNADLKEFERFYACPVEFAAPRTLIQFQLKDLHLSLQTADDRLLAILQAHCQEVLDRHKATAPSLIERVERLVVDRLTSDEARLESVATELGVSKRTLSRRLAELGTSFNDIIDDLRRELALTYLRDSELSMTEIAFLLGYTEVASFNTAFKRWTGATPGQARKTAKLPVIAPPQKQT